MQVVWELGRASVKDVIARLDRDSRPAYNTVQTMMNILTDKGYLGREREGRAFLYAPLVSRARARSEAVSHVLSSFFGGSRPELLQSLLADEDVDALEIERLRSMLEVDESEEQ